MRSRELIDLTALRALFALWVFAYHVNLHARFAHFLGPLGGLIHHGYLGVDGFFMLSGLILARADQPVALAPKSILRFWGKRLARLYPVHLAVIGLLAAMFLGGSASGMAARDPARFGLGELAKHLLLVQGWGFSHRWAWNYQSWSISTEWAGYLAFPALAAAFAAMPALAAMFFLPLCFFCLGLVDTSFHGLNLTFGAALLRFFPEFVAGIATMRLVPLYADELPGRAIAGAGAVILLGFSLIGSDLMMVLGVWLALAGLAMQDDAQKPPVIGQIAPLHWLGVISYSVYMSFAPVELIVSQGFRHWGLPPEAHRLAYCAAMAVLVLGLAVILHYSVELPARLGLNRWLDPKKAEALAVGAVPL
ncbi:MAG TPA: acyltransferase [Acetobacteraceae bacterium]|nr:acyltransferase [Acetobacteraceae bacterium]